MSEYRRSNDPYVEQVEQKETNVQVESKMNELPVLKRMDSNAESINETVKQFRLS